MQKKENRINNWDQAYKKLLTTYDERPLTLANLVNYQGHKFMLEDVLNYLKGVACPKFLEVGCGGAQASLFLALRGFDVSCVDNSPEAIRLAKDNFASQNAKGIFVVDDLLNSQLPKASYDCIMSGGLLEHFEDIRPVIHAMTSLLKPRGLQIHCIIPKKFSTDSIMNFVKYPARFIRNAAKRDFEDIFYKSFRDFPHYENSFSAKEYCCVFREEGNTIIKSRAGGLLYPFMAQLPFGAGNFLARRFSGALCNLIKKTDRSESGILHFLSPTFQIVCRKNIK